MGAGDDWLALTVGALVGLIEILSRYCDEPKWIFKNYATWVYIVANGASAFFALQISKLFNLQISVINYTDSPYIYAALIAFSSMAILRSSILNIQISGKNFNPGFDGSVNKLLKWVDRTYDRRRSCFILEEIEPVIKGVPFEAIASDVLLTCVSSMDGMSTVERDNLLKSRDDLSADGSLTSQAKSNHLAISIAKVTGMSLLDGSVKLWRNGNQHGDLSLQNGESLLVAARKLKDELFGIEVQNGE